MRFKKSAIIIIFSLGIIAVGIVARHVVFANAIVVNSNLDTTSPGDGDCTLREAINNANGDTDTTGGDCAAGSGTDTITFDSVMTITPSSGYTINTPIIVDAESGIGTCSPFNPGVTIISTSSSSPFSIVAGSSGSMVRGFRLIGDGSSASSGVNISNTSNVSVQCSSIGLDASGTGKAGFSNGIYVGVSSNITIGGLSDGDGNFISGNGIPATPNVADGVGIVVANDVSNLFIEGNYIGPDVTGSAAVKNEKMGIEFVSSTVSGVSIINNVISGNGEVDGNYSPGVNLGQGAYDVVITGVTVQGNKIGVSADGLSAMPNEADGIFLGRSVSDVLIGGSTEEQRNIIGSNGCNGISMDYNATDVTIKGNYIGIGADGVADVGNSCSGISKGNQVPHPASTNLQIGGTAPGEGNYIAYNAGGGISVQYGSDVTIEGNFIGVQADGQTLALNGTNAAIGSEGTQNLVIRSGNVLAGYYRTVNLSDVGGIVSGNYIGVANDGVTALLPSDNTNTGIYAENSTLVIGGELSEDGNIIDGVLDGITLIAPFDSSVIHNQIGGENGNSKGLVIVQSQDPVLVKENRILNNTVAGIVVVNIPAAGSGGAYASITENSITDNGGLGIVFSSDENEDLNPDTFDLVLNDIGDSDAGANNLLNRPVILSVDTLPPGQVKYYVDVPPGNYITHFYTNTTNGLSGSYLGEGETFIGTDTFTSTGSGAIETFTIPAGTPNSSYLTATVTQDLGSGSLGATSEFSNSYYGADLGTSDGNETYITDDGAYHIVTDSFLGDCVNADSGDGSYLDDRGPVRAGSFEGESPCVNDRDGVVFTGETVEIPGSVEDFAYIPTGPGELDDVVITGTYEGSALCQFFFAIATISPDNGDDADYFITVDIGDGCSNEINGPFKITPGVPQSVGMGLFVTFANATGHLVYQDAGEDGSTSVWVAQLVPASSAPSGEHTGPYAPGEEVLLEVSATDPGYLNIWVDINKNGSFQDSGEHVVVNETSSGVFGPSFDAPSSGGTYNMRVRYTTYNPGDMLPIGEALDGEVEDYTFEVAGGEEEEPSPVPGCMNTSALNYNSSATIDNGSCRYASGGGGSTGQAYTCHDPKAVNYSTKGMSNSALCMYATPNFTYNVDVDPTPSVAPIITENILSSIACPVFNIYARQGDKGQEIKLIQVFLNSFTGAKLNIDGDYGLQTTAAVKVFQQLFSKEVLDPWEPPLSNKPTGRWYKTTRMKANQLLGCPESPVILEDNGRVWSLPDVRP